MRHRTLGIAFTLNFNADRIGAVFVSREQPGTYLELKGYGMGFLDFKGGKVAINTGRNLFGVVTHRFGMSLSADDAYEIVSAIHGMFPQNAYDPARRPYSGS